MCLPAQGLARGMCWGSEFHSTLSTAWSGFLPYTSPLSVFMEVIMARCHPTVPTGQCATYLRSAWRWHHHYHSISWERTYGGGSVIMRPFHGRGHMEGVIWLWVGVSWCAFFSASLWWLSQLGQDHTNLWRTSHAKGTCELWEGLYLERLFSHHPCGGNLGGCSHLGLPALPCQCSQHDYFSPTIGLCDTVPWGQGAG